jgi:methylisocitrate lyase
MKKTTILRQLLSAREILVVPRVHDAMSALAAESVGFKAVQVSGFGVAGALLGKADIGLLTLSENVMVTRNIVRAVDVPVMADGDTGYGNALNVYRTIQDFEEAGAASINLEDQMFPKKCGHMKGKAVISADEMVNKIKAAVDARCDPDFVICARTDAIASFGIDDAIHRANLYAEAGADLVFVEAPTSREMIARIASEVHAPISINLAIDGKTPEMDWKDLEDIGVARVSVGGSYFIAAKAFKRAHEELLSKGTLAGNTDLIMLRNEYYGLVKMPFWMELEQRYLSKDELNDRYGKKDKNP